MAKGKTVYVRPQGRKGNGEPIQIFPGVKTRDLKEKVQSVGENSVLALGRGGSEVILEDDTEVYHQVGEGEDIYASDRGVFGRN